MPKNKKINPITVIILAKPKNLFVLEGDFMAAKNVQLILPNIYVIGNKDKEKILLKMLDIKRYFERIKAKEKKASDTSMQKMITNL